MPLSLSPVTLVLAAVVPVILFWLMGEGERGQGETALPPIARRLLFALLGGLVVLLLGAGRQPRPAERTRPGEDPGRAFRSYTQALLETKRSFVPLLFQKTSGETEAKVRAQAIREYQAAIRAAPTSATFRRQLGILLAYEGRFDDARAQFRRLAQILRERGDPGADAEARLWERIVGPSPPPADAVRKLRDQILALRLGWFEHLALATLYRRAGLTQRAEAEVQRASQEALIQWSLLSLVMLWMVLVALVGFIGGPIFLYLAARGKLRPVPFQSRVGPAVLWEAFILYMLLSGLQAVPRLLMPGWQPSTERSLTQTIFAILASDAVQFVSVAYLWDALRRRGLTLAEVGLHTRALAANVGFGLLAYALMLPWVFVVSFLTQWLGEHLFPDVAPPFHPLQALTAGAQDWWLRLALFVIAAVGAPFFEELFFRGCLHGALRRRFGAAAGVIASAALFAALHPQLPLGFLPIFFLGAVFAVIYEWRQSLIPGMVFHGVHNGTLFLLMNLLFPVGG